MLVPTTQHPEAEALERLGDEIAELSAHIEVATARLLTLIAEFDARAGWGNGFKSCAEWLSWRVGLDLNAAYERVRVARALPALPRIAQAFAQGELSYSKVRALTRVATPETEERLLTASTCMTAAHVERLVRAWRRVDRNAERQETVRQQRSRALYVYPDEDGMFVIRGRLTPEVGAVLRRALEAASDELYAKARVTIPRAIRPPPASGRPTRSASSPRRLCITSWTSAAPASGTRSWSMSTGRCWPIPTSPVSQCWRTASIFPRKNRAAWHAMPPG